MRLWLLILLLVAPCLQAADTQSAGPLRYDVHLPRGDSMQNMAKYADIITLNPSQGETGITASWRDDNPDVLFFVHQNYFDIGPPISSTAIVPSADYTHILGQDAWFYKDSNGCRIATYETIERADCEPVTCCAHDDYVTFDTADKCDCRWGLDLGNTDFQDWAAARATDLMAAGGSQGVAGGADGMTLDNFGCTWYYRDNRLADCEGGTNDGTDCDDDGDCTGGGVCRGHVSARPYEAAVEQTEASWQADFDNFLDAMKAAIPNDILIFSGCYAFNSGCDTISNDWLGEADGCMMEGFGREAGERWKESLEWVRDDIDAANAWFIGFGANGGEAEGGSPGYSWPDTLTAAERKLAIANALLVYHDTELYVHTFWRGPWSPDGVYTFTDAEFETEIPELAYWLGEPTEECQFNGSDVASREFQFGIVIVNNTGNDTLTFNVPYDYEEADGTPVSSGNMTIDSGESEILFRSDRAKITLP